MLECMEILSIAAAARIRVYAIKGAWWLDETIQSKIIAMAFSMAAEIERDLILARTTQALRARKAAGLPLGPFNYPLLTRSFSLAFSHALMALRPSL